MTVSISAKRLADFAIFKLNHGTMPLQELSWCMKELAQLQKEKNDWRCNSWLESATGRSTVLAAQPGKIPECACVPDCLPFAQFGTLSLCMVRCHAM